MRQFEQYAAQMNWPLTLQRKSLVRFLLSHAHEWREPLEPLPVYHYVKQSMPEISRSYVFRTLQLLDTAGIIRVKLYER